MQLVFGRKETPAAVMDFVLDCAQVNPNGFRNPPRRWRDRRFATLAEQACMQAELVTVEEVFERPAKRRRRTGLRSYPSSKQLLFRV